MVSRASATERPPGRDFLDPPTGSQQRGGKAAHIEGPERREAEAEVCVLTTTGPAAGGTIRSGLEHPATRGRIGRSLGRW